MPALQASHLIGDKAMATDLRASQTPGISQVALAWRVSQALDTARASWSQAGRTAHHKGAAVQNADGSFPWTSAKRCPRMPKAKGTPELGPKLAVKVTNFIANTNYDFE